jgi:hypothetical protein
MPPTGRRSASALLFRGLLRLYSRYGGPNSLSRPGPFVTGLRPRHRTTEPLVSFRASRQLSGWIPPPAVNLAALRDLDTALDRFGVNFCRSSRATATLLASTSELVQLIVISRLITSAAPPSITDHFARALSRGMSANLRPARCASTERVQRSRLDTRRMGCLLGWLQAILRARLPDIKDSRPSLAA